MKQRKRICSLIVSIVMAMVILLWIVKSTNLLTALPSSSNMETSEPFFASSIISETEEPIMDMSDTNDLLPKYTRTDGSLLTNYGVQYTVHSVEVTKRLPEELRMPSYLYSNIWMDLDGTIVSDHSYVIVELTMENREFLEKQLNYGGLYLYISDGISVRTDNVDVMREVVSFSKAVPTYGQYADLTLDFKVGDSIQYKVAFVQKDEDLRTMKNMILVPNAYNQVEPRWEDETSGEIKWNSSVKAILLDEFMDDMVISSGNYIPPMPDKPTLYAEDGIILWAHRQETITEVIVSKEISGMVSCPHFTQDEALCEDDHTIEGYSFVTVQVEVKNTTPDDPNIRVEAVDYRVGWDMLYLYSGNTLLDKLHVYGMLFTDDYDISNDWFGHLEKRGDTAQHTLVYIVPDEVLQEATDVFVQFNRMYQTHPPVIYNASERRLIWNTSASQFARILVPK